MPKDSKCLDCGTAITNIAKRCQPCNLKSNRGRKYSAESRAKMSAWQRGENNSNWKGDKRKSPYEISRKYYQSHKEQARKRQIVYRKNNIEKVKAWRRTSSKNMFLKWSSFFSDKTKCEVCGKSISFNSGKRETSIHFDHKSGNLPIKISPTIWLGCHQRNPANELLFTSCDFGILCQSCNYHLPTENRQDFLIKALRYTRGEGNLE